MYISTVASLTAKSVKLHIALKAMFTWYSMPKLWIT